MGFEPRLPDCSGCNVSGLQHGATTPSLDKKVHEMLGTLVQLSNFPSFHTIEVGLDIFLDACTLFSKAVFYFGVTVQKGVNKSIPT